MLGGTQSLHTNSYDEALSLPSQHAAELALRTQQIIAYETGVGDTIDPVAGSWYIEHLTDEVERDAADYVRRIDDMGGALPPSSAASRHRRSTRTRSASSATSRRTARSSSASTSSSTKNRRRPASTSTTSPSASAAKQQLARLRAERDNGRVDAALSASKTAARGDENMIPLIIEAVEHYATLGEICRTPAHRLGRTARARRGVGRPAVRRTVARSVYMPR